MNNKNTYTKNHREYYRRNADVIKQKTARRVKRVYALAREAQRLGITIADDKSA